MSLYDQISSCLARNLYPFHMPGHKRNPDFDTMNGLFARDLTEVDGADDLHCPQGILLHAQQRAACLYGCENAYFLVNGSTAGLLTAISAACPLGSSVLVARNCHKAVYNAIFLRNLRPVYLYPALDTQFGINGSINPADVLHALEKDNSIKAVVITSPTYDGVVSDIKSIARIAHSFGVALLVDAAHGAHHGFHAQFPMSAVQAGADAAVVSLHKTLPSPTGTAMLLTNSSLIKKESVRRYLDVYETSSPSYLFMSAMDACIQTLSQNKDRLFFEFNEKLEKFSSAMKELSYLRVLCMGNDSCDRHEALFMHDKSRIVVDCTFLPMNGFTLEKILRDRFGMEAEMSFGDCTVLLTGICDTQEGFDRLEKALLTIDRECETFTRKAPHPTCPLPETVCLPWEAECSDGVLLPLEKAKGTVCREYVCAYPPGTPVLVPGERITSAIIAYLRTAMQYGAKITGSSGNMPDCIDTCC